MTSLYKKIYTFITLILLSVLAPAVARALSADTYAATSRLASGKWVKIAVNRSGMYLLTDQQLREWGFSNPAAVKVYGYGAQRVPDKIDAATFIDDLPQTASEYLSGRGVVFFGEGPVSVAYSTAAQLKPVQNPFTTVGYYFLSENSENRFTPDATTIPEAPSAQPATTFNELAYHELEAVSPGFIGYMLVGEDFRYNKSQSFNLSLPGVDTSYPVLLEASFISRSLTGTATVTYTANGATLPSASGSRITPIPSTDRDFYHGIEGLYRQEFKVSAPSVTLGVSYSCSGTVTLANLNYLAATYKRKLSLEGGSPLVFLTDGNDRAFRLAGAKADTRVWDITMPHQAEAMNLSELADGCRTWSANRSDRRRYAAWNPGSNFLTATYVENVANQNLHGLKEADMVIFTMPQWRDQAERLADLHRKDAVDPLTVKVLTPNQIYNEFSSGAPDALSFRKLLKMMYDRQSTTDRPLRYALFLSRPICDIRQLTGEARSLGYPYMSAWFTDIALYNNTAYTTDDIYAFLEDNSGASVSSDKLSIAVGRMPVTSSAQLKKIIDKMERYYTNMPRSNWRNNLVITADDQDYGEHLKQAERFVKALEASDGGSDGFVKKIYTDAYPLNAGIYTEARQQLYRSLDEGTMFWMYTGHANPSSLTAEGLVTYSDLNSFYLRHYPVIYAATCSFLQWDSPTVSGAEILFNNPSGGVIAAISATRPVYIPNNGNFSAAMGRNFMKRKSDGRYPTLGEAYTAAKNDYRSTPTDRNPEGTPSADSNKLRYVLMGDPALRLVLPSSRVVLDRIAGVDLPGDDNSEPATLMARQQTTAEGRILNPDGTHMADFNGIIVATLYDAEETVTTLGNGEKGEPQIFDRQGGRLFVGNARVENGKFTLPINMPAEITNNYRNAAINLYAYESSGRDAAGVNRDFYVYGTDYDAAEDNIPPRIDAFYLNHPSFENGQDVNPSPVVIAEISDDRAINLSTAGIGHQIALYLDNGSKSFTDVADYFTPYESGQPGGTIVYPLEDLPIGAHTLRLRVWDTAPNYVEANIDFFVAKQITPQIYDVYTDCNPASTEANFYVRHDRPDRELTVTIEVFDMMGRRVWHSTQDGRSDMFSSAPVTWDLTDYGGHRVGRGIYLYRATISDEHSGEKTSTASRRLAVTAN